MREVGCWQWAGQTSAKSCYRTPSTTTRIAQCDNSSINDLAEGEVCGWDALKRTSCLDTELIVKVHWNLLSKQLGLNAVYCYCYFILLQDSSYSQPNRSSPPTDHSIFPLHTPSTSVTCASQNSYLSIHLWPGQRVSQTGRLQGQKGAAASSPSVQLREEKKQAKRQEGPAKRLPAKETAHEQSRHFVWWSSMPVPSVLPPGWRNSNGNHSSPLGKVLWVHIAVRCQWRGHMPQKAQGLDDLLLVFSEKPQTLLLGEACSEQKSAFASWSFLCNFLLPFCGLSRGG